MRLLFTSTTGASAQTESSYIMVIAYEMVKRAYERGYAQGLSEGRKLGRKLVLAEARKQNAAYYKRMQEARERGEDFNEPPPTFDDDPEERD